MYQHVICACISWYCKICWFPMKKCWCQQNSSGVVCHVIHIFLDLLDVRYNCAKFHHCRICVTDFKEVGVGGGGGGFLLPPIHEQPLKDPSRIGLTRLQKQLWKNSLREPLKSFCQIVWIPYSFKYLLLDYLDFYLDDM